jgi:iron complex transport system substrate-binding protein
MLIGGIMPKLKQKSLTALLAVVILGVAVALCGCVDQYQGSAGAGAGSGASAAAGATQAADGDAGSQVRLVATSPAVAQICARLDLELVGVCETSSTLPEQYQDLPTIGTAMSPDMEILASLQPDYVISPNSLQSDLQPKYAAANLASLFLDLKSVEGMYASIQALGEKFDRAEQAADMLAEFDEFMQSYKEATAGKDAPRVLVLMGLPGSYIVATESSYVGNLVKLAGGENIYGDGDGEEFLTANTEDMLAKEPDVILRAAHALPDQVTQMFAEEFETNDIWKHFAAVQNGRVFDLDSSLFNMSANFSYSDALASLQPMLYPDAD